MDRVRELGRTSESLSVAPDAPFAELRWKGMEEQLATQTRRGGLLQRALTCFYVALGIFVATAIALALVSYAARAAWVPSALGISGMLMLFYGCVMLLRRPGWPCAPWTARWPSCSSSPNGTGASPTAPARTSKPALSAQPPAPFAPKPAFPSASSAAARLVSFTRM